jgi:putative ABC transport system permease protein
VLLDALRNLRRRPLRSALTAGGVAIGVAALVLLGALSEKLTRLVAGGRDFAAGQITVSGAGTGGMIGLARGALLTREQLLALREVPGVRRVAPLVMFPVEDAPGGLPLTLSPQVFGIEPGALAANPNSVAARAAHGDVVPAAPDDVMVGSQVARHFHVRTGDALTVRGRRFRVAGVLEPTLTGPDSFVFMSFAVAQRLLLDSDPMLRRLALVPGATLLPIATAAAVFWEAGEDPEVVAARIRARLPGVTALSPAEAAESVGRALAVMESLILGTGLVALVVASLAVANTMFTAVLERRREIGLLRVVGATRRQVMGRLLAEATIVGVAGAALGLAAGAAAASGLNGVTERLGTPMFLVTGRLALVAALLPAALATLAGVWPAWRAARLTPTEATRYV